MKLLLLKGVEDAIINPNEPTLQLKQAWNSILK